MEKVTFIQCFSNVFIYLTILYFLWPMAKINRVFTVADFRKRHKLILILGFIFCLFPYWAGDYINTGRDYRLAVQGQDSNWESIYFYLSNLMPSYTFLRVAIWGTAFLLLNKFIQQFKEIDDRRYILLFFFTLCLPNFSYLRSAISMVMICLGIILLIRIMDENKSIISIKPIFPLMIIAASFFFHKSAIFGIAIAIISLATIFVKNIKLLVVVFILLVPVVTQYANDMIATFMMASNPFESSINIFAAKSYFDDSMIVESNGTGMLIQNILSRAQYYLFLALYIIILLNDKYKALPRHIICFGNFAALTIVIATLTQLVLVVTTPVLFYRLLYFSMIPMVVFLAYCYKNKIYYKFTKSILYVATCGTLYTLLYSSYNIL